MGILGGSLFHSDQKWYDKALEGAIVIVLLITLVLILSGTAVPSWLAWIYLCVVGLYAVKELLTMHSNKPTNEPVSEFASVQSTEQQQAQMAAQQAQEQQMAQAALQQAQEQQAQVQEQQEPMPSILTQ
jgi:hypothetical protein